MRAPVQAIRPTLAGWFSLQWYVCTIDSRSRGDHHGFMDSSRVWVAVIAASLIACGSSPKLPPPGVKVLGKEAQNDLADLAVDPADTTKATITFTPAPAELADLAVDNRLVAGRVRTVAPRGLLYKVVAFERSGDSLIVHGEAAPLSDVLVDEPMTVTGTLKASDIDLATSTGPDGMPLSFAGPRPVQVGLNWPRLDFSGIHTLCDDPLPCDISGHITFPEPQFRFDTYWDVSGLQRLVFTVTVDAELEANITGALRTPALGLGGTIDLFAINFSVIDIQIGPIPVVVVPRIDFKISTGITAGVQLDHAGLNTGVHLRGGIDHERGRADILIGEATTFGSTYGTPTGVRTSTTAEIDAECDAGLYFYNQFGPYQYFKMGPRMDFSTPRDPFFMLGFHVETGIGGRFDVLDHRILNLIDISHAFFDHLFEIFRSPNSAPSITYLAPTLNNLPFPDSPCFSCGFNQCCIGINEILPLDVGGYDLEDGLFTDAMVQWSSSNSLDVMPAGKMRSHHFESGGPGVRTVTATVTDRGGLASHVDVPVKLPNYDPDISISAPLNQGNFVGQTRLISAIASSPYFPVGDMCAIPGAATFQWTSDLPGIDTFVGTSASSCTGTAIFGSVGTRGLTFTATDKFGQTSSTQILVDVQAVPSCTVTITSPAAGTAPVLSNGLTTTIQLTATASGGCGPASSQFFTVTSHLQGGVTRTLQFANGASVSFTPFTARTTDGSQPLMDSDQLGHRESIDVIFTYNHASGTATDTGLIYYDYAPT